MIFFFFVLELEILLHRVPPTLIVVPRNEVRLLTYVVDVSEIALGRHGVYLSHPLLSMPRKDICAFLPSLELSIRLIRAGGFTYFAAPWEIVLGPGRVFEDTFRRLSKCLALAWTCAL